MKCLLSFCRSYFLLASVRNIRVNHGGDALLDVLHAVRSSGQSFCDDRCDGQSNGSRENFVTYRQVTLYIISNYSLSYTSAVVWVSGAYRSDICLGIQLSGE